MKHIAIVTNTAWNIYNFRMGLIARLLAEGYKVWAMAPMDEYVEKIKESGCSFVVLKELSRKGTNPIKELRLIRELTAAYRQYSIDIALHYTIKPNIYGSLACRKLNTKVINTVTGLGYSFLSNGLVNRAVKFLYRRAFKQDVRVAFQNQDDRKLFIDLGLVHQEKTLLIKGSGINTNYYQPVKNPKKDDTFIFLFVGRLLYDKGIQEFLEAALEVHRKKKNSTFWVVGGLDKGNPSALEEVVIQRYHEEGIINYIGYSDDVRGVMQKADAVVLPSYREGLPRVMLEGLALGKPLITTDTAGCRETVVDGENGFLVPVKSAKALEEAMLKMLELSDEDRARMGQKGRALALQEFDEQVIIRHYLKLIEKAYV